MAASTAIVNTSAGWVTPIQFTDTAGGTITEWYTNPLQSTTLSGLAVGNIRISESNVLANVAPRLEIAITDADGSNAVIWGAATAPVGAATTEGAVTVYVTGPDTVIAAQSRLRFRVYIDDFEAAMGTGYTSTLYYNSATADVSGDTYVTLPVTLTEIVGPGAPPGAVFTVNQINFGNFFAVSNNPSLGSPVNIVQV